MEYNNSEMSDCSSNSDGGSFINCEKESTLKKIAELKKKIMKLENTSIKKEKTKRKSNQKLVDKESFAITNKTKGSSNQSCLKDKSFNNKYNSKSQPTLSEEDDTEFSSDEPKQESMRLLVAEKLYPLYPTTEYRDMPINEINKCIDKFHKKNPSFPETVSDWAERSILNLSEMHKTNISVNKAKIRKPNEPLLVSNSLNIESLERLDNNKSLPSKKEAIEDVEVVRILPAKHPGRKPKRPGHKTKAAQPPDDEKGVEDAETIRIPPAKCPRRKCKAV
ncbi:uncharacterized protein OCT59_016472 [Rhizophagus irregularis]|uniref:uncharacterized protein n=1 Tax=Rhizophagus irregularis TaxID=588596 RepID=UPI0033273D13|nr:hypothetical protein OCT59_016472 [Rhizophagus irregularis]